MTDTAVVVITCKRFEQVWDPFFILFRRYWPDCPYKTYMITDFGQYDSVENITINADLGFASNLAYGLKKIPEDNIIYFQEDYLATDPFNNEKIMGFVKCLQDKNLGCLRLAPCPGPTAPWPHNKDLGILQPGDAYRVSTQTAIWSKETLLSLLVPGETGGDFEIKGTRRSTSLSKPFLSVWRGQTPTPYFITAVVRGEWQEGALELLKKENISTDNITRIIK